MSARDENKAMIRIALRHRVEKRATCNHRNQIIRSAGVYKARWMRHGAIHSGFAWWPKWWRK